MLWEPLWQLADAPESLYSTVYHYFNLLEGAAWCVFGVLVLTRYGRYRRSPLEPLYSLAFVLFGVTDFREAYVLSPALIAAKGVLLVALIWLRHIVLRDFYPDRRVF